MTNIYFIKHLRATTGKSLIECQSYALDHRNEVDEFNCIHRAEIEAAEAAVRERAKHALTASRKTRRALNELNRFFAQAIR